MVKMIDITNKKETLREATAYGFISIKKEILKKILENKLPKGNVLEVAKVGGILGAKKVKEFIPLCHPLLLTNIEIEFKIDVKKNGIEVFGTAKAIGKTGVEMEALTSVAVACLNIYDMCKGLARDMEIKEIYLLKKSGGKSGEYFRRK